MEPKKLAATIALSIAYIIGGLILLIITFNIWWPIGVAVLIAEIIVAIKLTKE